MGKNNSKLRVEDRIKIFRRVPLNEIRKQFLLGYGDNIYDSYPVSINFTISLHQHTKTETPRLKLMLLDYEVDGRCYNGEHFSYGKLGSIGTKSIFPVDDQYLVGLTKMQHDILFSTFFGETFIKH